MPLYTVIKYINPNPDTTMEIVKSTPSYEEAKEYALHKARSLYGAYVSKRKLRGYKCAYSDWATTLDGKEDNEVYVVVRTI